MILVAHETTNLANYNPKQNILGLFKKLGSKQSCNLISLGVLFLQTISICCTLLSLPSNVDCEPHDLRNIEPGEEGVKPTMGHFGISIPTILTRVVAREKKLERKLRASTGSKPVTNGIPVHY